MKRLADEIRKAIADDYAAGIPINNIKEKYNISDGTVAAIVDEYGIPRRYKRKNSKQVAKKCPNCKRKITDAAFKWCPYCGSDIRDEKDLLEERIEKAWSALDLMPSSARDELRDLLKDVSNYIKKH